MLTSTTYNTQPRCMMMSSPNIVMSCISSNKKTTYWFAFTSYSHNSLCFMLSSPWDFLFLQHIMFAIAQVLPWELTEQWIQLLWFDDAHLVCHRFYSCDWVCADAWPSIHMSHTPDFNINKKQPLVPELIGTTKHHQLRTHTQTHKSLVVVVMSLE
jgi:hypothetical protein